MFLFWRESIFVIAEPLPFLYVVSIYASPIHFPNARFFYPWCYRQDEQATNNEDRLPSSHYNHHDGGREQDEQDRESGKRDQESSPDRKGERNLLDELQKNLHTTSQADEAEEWV